MIHGRHLEMLFFSSSGLFFKNAESRWEIEGSSKFQITWEVLKMLLFLENLNR